MHKVHSSENSVSYSSDSYIMLSYINSGNSRSLERMDIGKAKFQARVILYNEIVVHLLMGFFC